MLKVIKDGFTPVRSTKYSAYVDLFAREDVRIGAGETRIVPLGVKINITNEWAKKQLYKGFFNYHVEERKEWFLKSNYLELTLISSLAVKGLIIPNGIVIIDLDCPNEIGLIVHNPIIDKNFNEEVGEFGSDRDAFVGSEYIINKGDKVAQCTLKEHKGYLMGYESDVVSDGEFGSTGEKA